MIDGTPYNTQTVDVDKRLYCAYCGKRIEPEHVTFWYGHSYDEETYYHCDCEDAKNEILMQQKLSAFDQDMQDKREALLRQFPKPKYRVKLILEEIEK